MSTSCWVAVRTLVLGVKWVLDLVRWCPGSQKTPLSGCPLPPGPPGLPLVGNVIGINTGAPWLTYANWASKHGDIMYTRLLGKHIVIVSSEKVAKDLLERRAKNYSDRPSLVTNSLFGMDFNTVLLPYGNRWRLHRHFFQQTFRAGSVVRFAPMQQRKSFQLLHRLLEEPNQFPEHIFEYTASIVMNAVYDYDPVSRKDPMVDIVEKVLGVILIALRPDVSIIIGAFPGLLSLPSWLPGMSFKKTAAVSRSWVKDCVETPFNYSLQKMKTGIAGPNMVYDALWRAEEQGIPADSEWTRGLKEAAATAFMAASETVCGWYEIQRIIMNDQTCKSNSVIMTFFLMMILFPDAQEKAQAQIDAIVGKDRLPLLKDRPSLPFVDALLRETLRYNPVTPLSIPHVTVDEDVYEGYRIPKGALVIANLWYMAHSASKYTRPYDFFPERFLNDDGSLKPDNTQHITFGFGRRMCVGRYFADSSVWIAITGVLAVFTLSKATDECGQEVPVVPEFTSGLAIHPLPFPCQIVPRVQDMDEGKLKRLASDASVF